MKELKESERSRASTQTNANKDTERLAKAKRLVSEWTGLVEDELGL
jgi:hypothetical protein